jgi:hypothetical protein
MYALRQFVEGFAHAGTSAVLMRWCRCTMTMIAATSRKLAGTTMYATHCGRGSFIKAPPLRRTIV